MKYLVDILNRILNANCFYSSMIKLSNHFSPKVQTNINLNLLDHKQERVLISYLSLLNKDFGFIQHSQLAHLNQMVKCFIDLGYCIDICDCNDMLAYKMLMRNNYHVVIGFGEVFKKYLKKHNAQHKILFITENNPIVVEQKYRERLDYFKRRHPLLKYQIAISRTGFYDIEQFELADTGILMSSKYNAESMMQYFSSLYTINANALHNQFFIFNEEQLLLGADVARYNFVWFGSTGIIHKGLDILLDAFKMKPEYKLHIYGLSQREMKLFDDLKADNTIAYDYINVMSEKFITDVVLKNAFVILDSCSEGMSTGVATCMMHGLIPILTKESGFDSNPCIIELGGYEVDDILKIMEQISSLTTAQIMEMRKEVYYYAKSTFSLEQFSMSFNSIVTDILKK